MYPSTHSLTAFIGLIHLVIDKKELKQCLYSLGEETGIAEIDKIMKDYGDPQKNFGTAVNHINSINRIKF